MAPVADDEAHRRRSLPARHRRARARVTVRVIARVTIRVTPWLTRYRGTPFPRRALAAGVRGATGYES